MKKLRRREVTQFFQGYITRNYLTTSVCGHSAVMPKGVGSEAQRRGCQPGCLGWDPQSELRTLPSGTRTQQLLTVSSRRAGTVVNPQSIAWQDEGGAKCE